jgi:hypothetical protein
MNVIKYCISLEESLVALSACNAQAGDSAALGFERFEFEV